MMTETDMSKFQTRMITAVCTEDYPGYPDPLIYVVRATLDASPEDIRELVIQQRIEELGNELEDEIRHTLQISLAWEGNLEQKDYLFDNRI